MKEHDQSVYRDAFEASLDAIICSNETGLITLWNPSAEQLFGYPAEEALGQPITLLIPPSDQLKHSIGFDHFIHTEEPRITGNIVEVKALNKAGRIIPVELSLSSRKNSSGWNFTVILRDIRLRKKAEKRLYQQDRVYRSVVQDLPALVCRNRTDGIIEYVNDAFCHYFGKSREQLVGSDRYALIPDATRDEARKEMASLTKGQPLIQQECQVIDSQGRVRWQRWTHSAISDDLGKIVVHQSFGEDITEQKEAESVVRERTDALQASEKRYRELYENSPLGYQSLDANGHFIEANPSMCEMLGYQPNEVIGHYFGDFLTATSAAFFKKNFPRFKASGEVHTVPFDLTTERGEIVSVAIDGRISYNDNGDFKQTHCVVQNVTERKRMERQIRTLSQAVEQSPVSVIITDTEGRIEYVNSNFEKITGYSSAEVIGQNPRILSSGRTPTSRYLDLWQTLSKGETWHGEFENRKKSGELFWEQAHVAPVLDESRVVSHYLAVKEDITLRKSQEDHILHQAHFDSLTDLPNRFLALDRLSQLINEAKRNNELIGVLFLDLDDFKKINDSLGHDLGDQLLIDAASRLRRAVRAGDTVGRLGGDEFIILLGGITDAADTRPVVENLLTHFRDIFIINSRELIITASVGIAIYPNDGETTSELLRNADSAMYYSKEQGRNTYAYFTDEMNRDVSRRLGLEEQMHGALERGEFRLCYQPLMDIKQGHMMGVEALLRWDNLALGEVLPDEFIPIAEKTGMIVPIGKFVISEALSMAAQWQAFNNHHFKMAINLSPRQFRDPGLVGYIRTALEQSGFPGKSLELEITEGVLMSGYTYIASALNELNEMGVGIVMDDFGTGYSSLSYLRTYPFDILKIDRSFVNDITSDAADCELVNAAIAMAHGLGLGVVAEGVETKEQLQLLATQGCEFAQGYLFSRPVSPEEITGMLQS